MRRRGIYTSREFYNHKFECAFVGFLWIWAISDVLSIFFLNLVFGGEDTSSLMVLQPALSLMSFMIIILGLRLRLALVLLCRFNVVQKTCCEGQGVGGWVGIPWPWVIFLRKFAHILKDPGKPCGFYHIYMKSR